MICPECGTEYREGFTECAYCHIPLVDALPEGVDPEELYKQHLREQKEAEEWDENKIPSYEELLRLAEEKGLTEEDLRRMVREMREEGKIDGAFFLNNEGELSSDDEDDADDEDSESSEESKKSKAPSPPYRSAADRLNDVQSSGFTLTAVGAVGLIATFLIVVGALPLSLTGPGKYITYIAMTGLFLLFFIAGLRSLMRLNHLKQEVVREEKTIAEIEGYFLDNFGAKEIDGAALDDQSGEDPYFSRIRYMREKLNERFLDLDAPFADYILENLYQKIFGEE
ncbi:MAG: hypothetical protein K5989_00995 [Lachnospiraceae bacterium]|nr:hypothetical protein [Lachnospiraceae bacterium]